MADYTHEFSSFPDSVMKKTTYKDVTNDVATTINKIKDYQAAGNYTLAAITIASNPGIKDYMIGVDFYNALIEEQRNTEIFAKQVHQSVYIGDEPATPINGDVWIGDD